MVGLYVKLYSAWHIRLASSIGATETFLVSGSLDDAYSSQLGVARHQRNSGPAATGRASDFRVIRRLREMEVLAHPRWVVAQRC